MSPSLRLRITAWYVSLLAVIIASLGVFLTVQLRADLTRAIDTGLRPAAAQIADDVRIDGPPEFHDSSRSVLKGEQAASQLLGPDGRILVTFGGVVADRPMAPVRKVVKRRGRGPPGRRPDARPGAGRFPGRRRRHRPPWPPLRRRGGAVRRAGRPLGRPGRLLLGLGGPAALLVTALAGWWLARRSLRPIEQITGTAEAIGVDRLTERVPVWRSNDEVAHLARTFNTMLDRITLAAADDGVLQLDVAPLDLAALAATVAERLAPVARRRGVEVACAGPPVTVLGDPVRLGHAVCNVLENAIDFSPPGGTVHLTTAGNQNVGRLIVADDGPGIPEHLAERVFDRFFRVDPSRSRATGGSGLAPGHHARDRGAHGGRVRSEQRARGSTFAFELPRSADTEPVAPTKSASPSATPP